MQTRSLTTLDPHVRRVLVLISAIVLVDTSFYAAITPLLPYYADQLDLTKASAGMLAATYPAGTVIASIPMALLASRIGARPVVALGLVLLGVSSLTFGLAHALWLLDAARFAQGVGGAATWTAGLGWLAAEAPRERRAEILGTAFAAAVAGALLGPVVGALARAIGTAATFSGVAAIAGLLLAFMLREHAAAETRAAGTASEFAVATRQPQIRAGAWIAGVSGLAFGVLDVLLPLKMGALGASGAVIAATFIGAAALESASSRPVGRYADRGGSHRVALAGLMTTIALTLLLPVPDSVPMLFVLGMAAGPLIGALWIPALAWLAEGSEAAGIDSAHAFGIQSTVWAGAQAIGAGPGGALAHATSDFVPYALVACVALATALVLRSPRSAPAPARKAPT